MCLLTTRLIVVNIPTIEVGSSISGQLSSTNKNNFSISTSYLSKFPTRGVVSTRTSLRARCSDEARY